MSVIVKKFGGTSVATVERIEHIADQIYDFYKNHPQIVVVVSAMEGETNKLENLAYSITNEPAPRELDALLATGEQVTISLLALALIKRGCSARSYTGVQLGITTEHVFNNARIKNINLEQIYKDLQEKTIVIVAGFQGVSCNGSITTLGRGGSDITAVALSAVLNAKECQIYTDVDGVYTADPNIEPKAKKLNTIDFSEMLELSGLGAKVMQIRAVEIASYYNVPIRVLSSFNANPSEGTLIANYKNNLDYNNVIKVTYLRDQVKIIVTNIQDPNSILLLLKGLANSQIQFDMLTNIDQQLSFVTSNKNLEQCNRILCKLFDQKYHLISYKSFVKVSLVGLGLAADPFISYQFYKVLNTAGIDISQIATAETKVSILLNDIYLERAVKVLHEAFVI